MRLRSQLSLLLLLRCVVQAAPGQFSRRGDGPYLCSSATDVRVNCTRCAPGWRGVQCSERVAVAPCTLHHCLDFSQCPRGLTVHVYSPPQTELAAYVTARASAVWTQLVSGLLQSKRHVADPAAACLLLPWFDTLCTSNDCTNPKVDSPKTEWLIEAVEQLPLWRGTGRNHLLLDMSSNHAPRLPVNQGIYFATSFWAAGNSYRHEHDVSIPLWNQKWEAFLSENATARRRSGGRDFLLSFRGQRMFWCASCAPQDLAAVLRAEAVPEELTLRWARNRLDELHDGKDVFTVGTCTRELSNPTHCNATCKRRCNADATEALRYDFHDLLWRSKFGLVLPGITPMSYRLSETMACGAIPVIVSDFMVLPFQQLLNWTSFSIRVPEALLSANLVTRLRAVPAEQVHAMRLHVAVAYERCFASPAATVLCGIEELEHRLFRQKTGMHA